MASEKSEQPREQRHESKKAFELFYDAPLFLETDGELNLSYEEIGELVVACQRYDQYGIEPPPFGDRTMRMAWGELSGALDRNMDKYRKTSAKRRIAALKKNYGEEWREHLEDAEAPDD